MKISRICLLSFMLWGMMFSANAQLLDRSHATCVKNYAQFSAILHNGEPIINENTPDGPLRLQPNVKGILSVSSIDRSGKNMVPVTPIGFNIAVKNWRSNTIWMYSEKTLYEVDLEELMKKVEFDDRLFFITVDRLYQLPRHEIVMMDGC